MKKNILVSELTVKNTLFHEHESDIQIFSQVFINYTIKIYSTSMIAIINNDKEFPMHYILI